MSEDTVAAQDAAPTGAVGLGGWLILPAINMVWDLLQLLWGLYALALLKSGALTLPQGLDAEDPAWGRLLNYEANTSILLVCLLIALLVLFFSRSWIFPKAFIAFLALGVFIRLFDLLQIHGVDTLDAGAYHGSFAGLMLPVISCVVWSSYFLQSVRVRNTFTRPWPVAKPSSPASS
ncbi:MAG TPA: DUF2569 domain-containing protein [Gammaproteobacteria bacterium]|jgi:hypothetical protein